MNDVHLHSRILLLIRYIIYRVLYINKMGVAAFRKVSPASTSSFLGFYGNAAPFFNLAASSKGKLDGGF